jgi:hypothetical protein
MARVQWNHGGYDAVFVNKVNKLVRFVQVTRGERHSFNSRIFCRVSGEAYAAPAVEGRQLEMGGLFDVPIARLFSKFNPLVSSTNMPSNHRLLQ